MSEKNFFRLLRATSIAVVLMVLILAMLVGCGQKNTTPAPGKDQKNAGEKFPTRNVTLVVPFKPGGSTDTLARALAPALQAQLGVPVTVENVAGAGAQIGYSQVFRAEPDGYKLVVVDQPTMQIGEITGGAYKTNEFTKLFGITVRSHALVVRYDDKATNVEEFIKEYKGKTVNCSSAGLATANELQIRLMNKAMGLDLKPIPFGGAADQLAALLGKQVDVAVPSLENAIPLHKDKKVRILAVLLDERHPLLPDVPTLKEAGYPEGYVTATTGVMGPPGLPQNVAEILEKALAKAMEDDGFKKWVQSSGTQLKLLSAAEYDASTKKMYEKIQQYADIFKKEK